MMEGCRGLSEGQLDTAVEGTYGTIRDTITHLVRAESGYVFRLKGGERIFGRQDPFPGIDRAIEVLEQTGAALEEVAADLDPNRIIEIVTEDATTQIPGFVVLLQAVNHATDHRGHIATILTQLGQQPPDLDLWSYDEAGLSRA